MMSSGRWRGVGPAGACSSSRQLRLRLTQRRRQTFTGTTHYTTLLIAASTSPLLLPWLMQSTILSVENIQTIY